MQGAICRSEINHELITFLLCKFWKKNRQTAITTATTAATTTAARTKTTWIPNPPRAQPLRHHHHHQHFLLGQNEICLRNPLFDRNLLPYFCSLPVPLQTHPTNSRRPPRTLSVSAPSPCTCRVHTGLKQLPEVGSLCTRVLKEDGWLPAGIPWTGRVAPVVEVDWELTSTYCQVVNCVHLCSWCNG